MFLMPWLRDVATRKKPTAHKPCRGYELDAKYWLSVSNALKQQEIDAGRATNPEVCCGRK
jgi:hypothetical protein